MQALARSSERQSHCAQDSKTKRKVGRPITYCGDPFSPHLKPEQRRVILRRVANRESARRVRARRQDELERLSQQVSTLQYLSLMMLSNLAAPVGASCASVPGHPRILQILFPSNHARRPISMMGGGGSWASPAQNRCWRRACNPCCAVQLPD